MQSKDLFGKNKRFLNEYSDDELFEVPMNKEETDDDSEIKVNNTSLDESENDENELSLDEFDEDFDDDFDIEDYEL